MAAATTSLQLLGSFRMCVGRRVAQIPLQAQRLLAYLAINEVASSRQHLAERLWPYSNGNRAHANLRTALWRIRREAPTSVAADNETVSLEETVVVDYRELVRPGEVLAKETVDHLEAVATLRNDLLPGWDEEWLLVERERSRQLRMRRLEELSHRYLELDDVAAAIEAAYASIEIEPLRESAHLALIEAHVRDGNLAEAANQALRLARLVRSELGISPSDRFRERLASMGIESAGVTQGAPW
jgi:DNA-binding SARP family transcriptional activator